LFSSVNLTGDLHDMRGQAAAAAAFRASGPAGCRTPCWAAFGAVRFTCQQAATLGWRIDVLAANAFAAPRTACTLPPERHACLAE